MPKPPTYKHALRYPVDTLVAGETVLEKWPDLAVHAALVEYGFGDNDPLLRYAILLGEGSGLHRALADYGDRKREALRLAGVATDHPRYRGAFDLTDHGVQVLRWTWLKLFSSRKFRAYIAICAAYDQNCLKVEAPILEGGTVEYEKTEKGGKIKSGTDLKADAEQRAYKLRNELIPELAKQDKLLADLELALFFGDQELKELAEQKIAAEYGGMSWEDQIFGSRRGK